METDLDAFLFQETINQDMIISSWLEDANGVYDNPPDFSQKLQDLEDHLFNLETDPISSVSIPVAESQFLLDPCTLETSTLPQPNLNYESVAPVEQPEPDVCDTFLNDYEFYGLISPNDLSPADGEYDSATNALNYADQPVIVNEAEAQDESNDEDGSDNDEDTKKGRGGRLNSKNLVSERNRRKRLSHQLLSLRALVPNITKMDKRSVLVDALSYLTNIHQESEKLEKELKQQQQQQRQQGTNKLSELRESNPDNPSSAHHIPPPPCSAPTVPNIPRQKPQITEIDAEKIEDKRFVVKIICKGNVGGGSGTDVVRVMEALDFEIMYTALQQLEPQQILVTIFIRVRKQGKMTEDKLKRWITSMALKTGLTFQNP